MPPSWGANGLLHPGRRPLPAEPTLDHRAFEYESDGLRMRGWLFPAQAPRRGVTVVYLHGIGDNRASGTWIAERLVQRGFDVLAYDGRGHGASEGDTCTYGVREKHDLSRALDALGAQKVVLVGVSLGAAVALQAAPDDPRIDAVVAVSSFADLRSIADERAPFFASRGQISDALAIAEREGRFRVADASPLEAARRIRVPVLLVHGAKDAETVPQHSLRIHDALSGARRLILVEDAGHGDALGRAWTDVESWLVAH
jgi:uncharacterized protein